MRSKRTETRDGHDFLIENGHRFQIHRRDGGVLLNQAAACADHGIPYVTFTARQKRFGWPGLGGAKLEGATQAVTDTLERTKDQLFYRQADVDEAVSLAPRHSEEKDYRVFHDGAWRCSKGWAIRALGMGGKGATKRFNKWCEDHGVEFERLAITTRKTGWRSGRWCVESLFLDAKDGRQGQRSRTRAGTPPTIAGRESVWELDLLESIREALGRSSIDRRWAKKLNRRITEGGIAYVDKEQGEALLKRMLVEAKWEPKTGYENEERLASRLGYKAKARFRLYSALRVCREEKLIDFERSPLRGHAYFYRVDNGFADALRLAVARVRWQWVQPETPSRQFGWKAGQRVLFLAALGETRNHDGDSPGDRSVDAARYEVVLQIVKDRPLIKQSAIQAELRAKIGGMRKATLLKILDRLRDEKIYRPLGRGRPKK
jgi:hypothetical protein